MDKCNSDGVAYISFGQWVRSSSVYELILVSLLPLKTFVMFLLSVAYSRTRKIFNSGFLVSWYSKLYTIDDDQRGKVL